MDDYEDNPYDSPVETGRDKFDKAGEEYAPLVMQWGLLVWTAILMGLVTAVVLAVESIPAAN